MKTTKCVDGRPAILKATSILAALRPGQPLQVHRRDGLPEIRRGRLAATFVRAGRVVSLACRPAVGNSSIKATRPAAGTALSEKGRCP